MAESETPEALLLTDEIRDTVNRAIENLPEDLRTAIVLRELEGLELRGHRADDGLPGGHGALANLPRARGDRQEAKTHFRRRPWSARGHMSEQIREQVSAFLDGELPGSETELLLKRLTRDAELRESFGRYALIGESLRGGTHAHLTRGFAARVNAPSTGTPPVFETEAVPTRPARWWRPLAGAAVAAGVAAVAVVALQQRAISPSPPESAAVQNMANTAGPALPSRSASGIVDASHDAVVVQNAAVTRQTSSAKPTEALSYTVPAVAAETPRAMPAARLTNYVFAHSKYSSVLGQNDVLNDLLSDADAEDAAAAASRDSRVAP